MTYKIIAVLVTLVVAAPALAYGASSATSTGTNISCVADAVATREATLDASVETYLNAVKEAYADRKIALATAYQESGIAAVKGKVRSAWQQFKTDVKAAKKAWQSERKSAWKTFKANVKDCRASSDLVDSSNEGSEAAGG